MFRETSGSRLSRSVIFVFVLLGLSACTTNPKIFVDSDPAHSFSGYETFSWIGDEPMLVAGDQGPNALVAARLKNEVRAGFEAIGYKFVAKSDDADFVVSFTVGARNGIDIREYEIEEYFGPYNSGVWHRDRFGYILPGGRTTTVSETREYSEGTLAIDVFDVGQRKPVWHAGAKKRLTSRELNDGSVESIRNAITQVLFNFPPRLIPAS